MRKLLLLGCVLSAMSGYAQTKIKDGTVTGSSSLPNSAAILDLESSNKGVLLPRIALTNTTTWGLNGSAIAGMSIYNTNVAITSTDAAYPVITGGIGQYYFDGTGWVGVKGASTSGDFWSLTGNTGTNPLTNYLGTTDAQPLKFKVSGLHSGYIGLPSYPGGGSQDLNTTFGYRAGGDVVARMLASTDYRKNTAIGYNAMATGAVGAGSHTTENTALGFEAGNSLGGSSTRNTFLGSVAGASVTNGSRNTAVGQASMFFSTGGEQNVALGWGAGANSGTSSYNTYIGTQSGANG